ncbi:MAG: alcohol dehydrogenase catalytic domain-containing protein, partial [Mycobacterium sp.]|nr:alcohol dehydrogenase catalytic domain-containing protein [Mycobacterium sp.]
MKAAQLVAPGEFVVHDISEPTPAPGQALLQVVAAGMCHSDVHIVHGALSSLPLPFTLGHETTAKVLDPNGAPGVQAGQNVIVAGIWGCNNCRPCRLGRANACEKWARTMPIPIGPGLGFAGGMAERMVAPYSALVPIGDLDPVAAAPLSDAAVSPAHGISQVRDLLTPDATVLVIGIGGLGHMALQILRATSACRIIAVDKYPERLARATSHGADLTVISDEHAAAHILELTDGLG